MTSPYSFDQCVCIPLSLSPMHSYTHTHTHRRYGFVSFKPYVFFLLCSLPGNACAGGELVSTWKQAGALWHVCERGVRSGGSGLRICVCIVGHGGLSCVHCGPWNKKRAPKQNKTDDFLAFFKNFIHISL